MRFAAAPKQMSGTAVMTLRLQHDLAVLRAQVEVVLPVEALEHFEAARGDRRRIDLPPPELACEAQGGRFVVTPGRERHPITQVTWEGALRYCRASGLRLGLMLTLEKRAAEPTARRRCRPACRLRRSAWRTWAIWRCMR